MILIYGLKSCDTCRKARRWLEERNIPHEFVDLRAAGVSAGEIDKWAAKAGWETLLNRRGTTWRSLGEDEKARADAANAAALMAEYPALIKRPVFLIGDQVAVGFDDAIRQRLSKV